MISFCLLTFIFSREGVVGNQRLELHLKQMDTWTFVYLPNQFCFCSRTKKDVYSGLSVTAARSVGSSSLGFIH